MTVLTEEKKLMVKFIKAEFHNCEKTRFTTLFKNKVVFIRLRLYEPLNQTF